MTLLEKVQELQSIKPPLSQEDFNSKLNAYKASQPKEELKEDAKVDSKETKDKPESNTETEGKTNDSANADQGVESGKSTKSDSESGDLQPSEKNDFDFLNGNLDEVFGSTSSNLNNKLQPEQPSKEQQEAWDKATSVAKPNETYNEGSWDYKYELTDDGPIYSAKKKDSEDWKVQTVDDSVSNIASMFGHNNLDRSKYAESNSVLESAKKLNLITDLEGDASKITKDAANVDKEFLEVADIYEKDIKLNEEELTTIADDAVLFYDENQLIPEEKEEQYIIQKTGNIRTRTVKTGEMIPNPDFDVSLKGSLSNKAAQEIADKKRIPLDELNLEDPEIKKAIRDKVISNRADEQGDKKEQRKMTDFIDSVPSDFSLSKLGSWLAENISAGPVKTDIIDATDVWDKGKLQKTMTAFQENKSSKLNTQQTDILDFATKVEVNLELLEQSFDAVQNAEYQTPSQVASANKTLKQLSAQRNKMFELLKGKYKELDDSIENSEDVGEYINKLERNHSLIPILINNAENSAIDMGQGIETLAFKVANLPNDIEKLTGVDTQMFNPVWQMGGKYLVNGWGEKRGDVHKKIDKYKEMLMGDISEGLSIEDLETGADWGKYLMATTGSLVPQMATMVATGGAGVYLVTATAGGGKLRQYESEMEGSKKEHAAWVKQKPNKQEGDSEEYYQDRIRRWKESEPAKIDYNAAEMWGGALTSMGAEFVGGKLIAMPMINRAKAFKGLGVKAGFTKEFARKFGAQAYSYVGDVASEGIEEVFAEGAGNLYDRFILGKDVNIFDGWKDNFFAGSLMANGFKAPALFAPYVSSVQTPGDLTNIKQKQDKIKGIINTIQQNPKMSKTTKDLLESDIVQNTVEINNSMVNSMNRYSNMPREDINVLGNIDQQTFKIDNQIKAVLSDKGIEVGKDKLISDLQNKKLDLQGQKNELIEKYVDKEAESTVDGKLVVPTNRQIQEGSEVVANQLGDTGITRFDNTEDLLGGFETLKAQGIQLEVTRDPDTNEILPAEDQGYGLIATLPNGTQQVIINNASSEADGVIPADKHEVFHAFASKVDPDKKLKMGMDLYDSLQNDSNITVDIDTKGLLDQYKEDLDDGSISEADFYEEVMAVTSDALTPDSKGNTGIKIKEVSALKALGNKILETVGWKQSFKDGNQVLDFLKAFNKDVISGKGLSQETLDTAGVTLDEVDMGLNDDAVDLGTVKKSQKLTSEQDQKAQDKVKEIQELQEEANELAEKYKRYKKDSEGNVLKDKQGNPILDPIKGPKQQRLEKELAADIKPTVDSFVESRTKALYDPIAPDAKKNVTRQEFVESMKSDITTMVSSEFEAKQPLEKFITSRGYLRASSLAERLGVKSVEEGITQGMEAAEGVAAEDTTVAKETKDTSSKIKPSSFISNEAVAKIKEQVQEKIKGIDPKNLTFKKLGDLAPEIIAQELGIPVKKLTSPTANLSKGDATAIQQFVNKNADKLLKILPEGAVVEAATDKLLGTSTGVPKGLLNAFYTKQARLGKGAGLAPFKLNKGISKADFLETFGIVEGKKAEGFDARSPQAQALKGIASLYGKLVTNEIVRSDIDLSLEAKQDVAAGKNRAMASKKPKGRGIKQQIHQDSGKDLVSKTVDSLTRTDGISAGFGNALLPYIVTSYNLSSGGNSARPNYVAITDASKTRDKDKAKTEKALEDGEIVDLSKLRGQIRDLGLSESGPQFTNAQLKEMSLAVRASSRSSIAKNQDNIEAINSGKNSFYDGFYKAYDANPSANLPGLKQIIYPADQSSNATTGRKLATAANDANIGDRTPYLEHWLPYGQWALTTISTFDMPQASRDAWKKFANEHYYQENISSDTQTAVDKTYPITLESGEVVVWKSKDQNHPLLDEQLTKFRETGDVKYLDEASKLSDIRKYPGVKVHTEVNPFKHGRYGVTDAVKYGIQVSPSLQANPNVQHVASALIHEVIVGNITSSTAQKRMDAYKPIGKLQAKASKKNTFMFGAKINTDMTIQEQIDVLGTYDKAATLGRKLDQPVRKIRVFDFDDTLARTKSNVLYTMPDGTTGKIDAATFAKEAGNMEAEGVEWDFSEFSKVMQGSKGPLLDVAKIIADKRGTDDVFVLTARPADAAGPIKEFLASMGLDIPLANITGLGDGAPSAKGNWIAQKAADGYNDFYFADDHTGNVKAVKEVLDQIDVKSKVQLAKASKKKVFNEIFNDIIEDSTGIESYKTYSPARAQTIGASKGKWNFLIPASAEDFTGLLYRTLGKGKKGDAQMAFYKTNLLDPYNKAEIAVVNAKIQAANDFKALKSNLKTLPKSLSKLTGIGGFTFSNAVRVAAWTRQGMEVPGLSKRDVKELNDFVSKDAELNTFVDELIKIQKGKPYPKPKDSWLAGSITTDITQEIEKVNRKEYMQEFLENADIIFSEENLSKLEAAYGSKYVEALKDNLRRMKSGSNRPIGGSRVANQVLDWLNNSVGAVMFLNTRSAILQTLSAVNFIQVSGPNNILAAGKAFANQKQYWGDFMTLMNSPYLVERRNGLKINVSESEIADAVAESSNKPKAALAFLLSKGFVMTRFADSFAIASGGSTFYRNTVDALVKGGMDQKAAEKQAFDEFRALSEESQQSSNPSKISQQQASGAGRVILAFANTPMQYARIIKRSSQDLINGRGDWKTNVSKIAYYGVMQNVIFNSLQTALFALAFDDEEDEEKKDAKLKSKTGRIVNGMVDSLLKGGGIAGVAVGSLKNALMTIAEENDKKSPDFSKAIDDLIGFSPPLSAKFRKLKGAANTFSWNRKEIKEEGFNLNNPAYLASAQVISGLTNIPVDRAIKKLNNIRSIFSDTSAKWQKVALGLGWSTWDVGLPFYGVKDKEVETPETILRDKIITLKKDTNTKEQKQMLLDLGLSKKDIKKLKYEEDRVKKIIALQNKKKK